MPFRRPERDDALPNAVRALIAGRTFEVAWHNELGGLTFMVESGTSGHEFIKWTPTSSGIDLVREVVRLRWAGLWLTVPRVLDYGEDAEGAWLIRPQYRVKVPSVHARRHIRRRRWPRSAPACACSTTHCRSTPARSAGRTSSASRTRAAGL